MHKDKPGNSFFSAFLREDAPELTDVLHPEVSLEKEPVSFREKVALPNIPRSGGGEEPKLHAYWRNLRTFFRGGKGGGIRPKKTGLDLSPALLASYRGREYVRSEYPFHVASETVAYSDDAHLALFNIAVRTHRQEQWDKLEKQLVPLIKGLTEILEIEKSKSPEATDADHLHQALDFADSYIDFDELAAVLPISGVSRMPEDRFRRLEQVLATLASIKVRLFEQQAILIVDPDFYEKHKAAWDEQFSRCRTVTAKEGQVCRESLQQFEELMQVLSECFAAIRIAQLELQEQYMPEVHDEYFEHFEWKSLSVEELAICPPVVLIAGVETLLRKEWNDITYLLSTGFPVRMMAIKSDARTGFYAPGVEAFGMQQELGSLAVAHRNTYVLQSSPVSPGHLYQGILESLAYPLPGIWYVLVHEEDPNLPGDNYLWTSAAVESREFPGFIYNGAKGPNWGSRFDISINPQPTADWPEHELKVLDSEAEETILRIAFTFADFAAQDPVFFDRFEVVPSEFWTKNLIPLAEYLALSSIEAYGKVPFIWMIDSDNRLQKVAVTWSIVHACRGKQDFWHYLQENAGVNNYHVEKAEARLRREFKAEQQRQMVALKETHQAEMRAAVEKAAAEAMERLAAALLDMDAIADITAIAASPVLAEVASDEIDRPKEEEPEGPPVAKPDEPDDDDIVLSTEAWIDTPLCTTCNECTHLNGRIFKYNADKQAYIADPRGGPFADIVKAAELCPAAIIHPGAPLDPDEPGLEELIKRAEPFNT